MAGERQSLPLIASYFEHVAKGDIDSTKSSLLVIIIDSNPFWWGQNSQQQGTKLSLTQCLDCVMAFANSHLIMNHLNKLAVIASHTNQSQFLYPKQESKSPEVMDTGQECVNDGKYELFSRVNEEIKNEIKSLVLTSVNSYVHSDSLLAGSMAMALCYIHRMDKEAEMGQNFSSRILVIKGSEDNPSQYMNFMNTVFTAQKQNVVIDSCILDNESGLLQQASDITGGIYLKIPQMKGLLEYLLWVYLPDPSIRHKLTLPPRAQVDYRAACFCHRNLIDIGYVCSVCLSIFCSFSPICSTCQTTFKLVGPPKQKKKSKRQSQVS